jgi:hypothetical protein
LFSQCFPILCLFKWDDPAFQDIVPLQDQMSSSMTEVGILTYWGESFGAPNLHKRNGIPTEIAGTLSNQDRW